MRLTHLVPWLVAFMSCEAANANWCDAGWCQDAGADAGVADGGRTDGGSCDCAASGCRPPAYDGGVVRCVPCTYNPPVVTTLAELPSFWRTRWAENLSQRNFDIRQHFALATNGTRLLVVGGNANSPIMRSTILHFDVSSGAQAYLGGMNRVIDEHVSLAVIADQLLAFGGSGGIVASFSFDAGTWSAASAMPRPRRQMGAIVVGGKVLLFGGSTLDLGRTPLADVDAFDPDSGIWTSLAPMPSPRRAVGVAELNGEVFVIGGERAGRVKTIDVYQPATNSWRPAQDLALAGAALFPVTFQNGLVVFGPDGSIQRLTSLDGGWQLTAPAFNAETTTRHINFARVGTEVHAYANRAVSFHCIVASSQSCDCREYGNVYRTEGVAFDLDELDSLNVP